ncbi:hypothetical protein FSP39_011211 [Pinctada imbricata]|uniref:Uncharacterized protein n=1 Tax=Pinctada imbricata TaxID=66713 RepID=A0AA89C6N8_PINIB|nr:hypothetical protein FSP39_011211 [Pinctada imbricata]
MAVREQRYQRRQWNNYKRKERERRFAQTLALTPPSSPLSVNDDLQHQPSRQLSSSRKKIKREKAKCYKENEKLRVKLKVVQQRVETYKKRWIREKGQKEKGNKGKDTPRKKKKNQESFEMWFN